MVKPPEKVIFVLCHYSLYAVCQGLTTYKNCNLLMAHSYTLQRNKYLVYMARSPVSPVQKD